MIFTTLVARGNERASKDIVVVTQSPQSPDFNFLDLAFFHIYQSDVMLMAEKNRQDLIKALEKCLVEYDT